MSNSIDYSSFIKQLIYYLKIGIYINKGTDNDALLDRCIKMCNKYRTIRIINQMKEEESTFVRKCLKRLNLVLKVDSDGNPVDVRDKMNQLKMPHLRCHPSISNNDLEEMVKYASKNNINILVGIPLTFILRESKYRSLLWQYTRSLFYLSQLVVCDIDDNLPEDESKLVKQQVYDESLEKLEKVLETISIIEEESNINKLLTEDNFLKAKLVKSKVDKEQIKQANKEIKDMLKHKGLSNNNAMCKMIDSITDKLAVDNLLKGNIFENMFGLARNVAMEMKQDIENDPESIQETIGTLAQVLRETIDSPESGKDIPNELKSMFDTILSAPEMGGNGNQVSHDEIFKSLEGLIENNGLDRESFYQGIQGTDGQLDLNKLQTALSNIEN